MSKEDWYRGEYPPSIMEAFCLCGFLTGTLGYSPEDLSIMPEGKMGGEIKIDDQILKILIPQKPELPLEEMERLTHKLGEYWDKMPIEELRSIWAISIVNEKQATVLECLKQYGIAPQSYTISEKEIVLQ